jgi:hypothetical protein
VRVTELPTGRPGQDATHGIDPPAAPDQPASRTPASQRLDDPRVHRPHGI